MKRTSVILFMGCQVLAASAIASPVVDLAITSDMASVEASQLQRARGSQWTVGAARNGDTDATLAFVAYNVVGDVTAVDNLRASLGWKALYHNTFQSEFSLAVGGSVRYELPEVPGLGIEGSAYLAPDVLNTGDAERYQELTARVTYQLYPRATVFAGWTDRMLKYEGGAPVREVEIADGLLVGFSLGF